MIDFTFQNPAKIIFGRTALSHLGEEALKYGNKALLVYGGGSVKRIGLYDQVKNILAENRIAVWELCRGSGYSEVSEKVQKQNGILTKTSE